MSKCLGHHIAHPQGLGRARTESMYLVPADMARLSQPFHSMPVNAHRCDLLSFSPSGAVFVARVPPSRKVDKKARVFVTTP